MSALTLPPLNPVLARELKQRMRGRLTWLVVSGYLAILALILRFVYLGASQSLTGSDFADPLASATVGRSIFHWLLFFMMMLVCFIVPGLTASTISGERERQTLVSLQVTLLRPRSIVLGKLLSSLAFTSFLVVASLPLLSVPFLVGGVSVTEVLKGVAMILGTAVVLASVAVACSALLRRTQAATVIAYGVTAALIVGTFIVYGGQRAMDGPGEQASPAILALNPFVATADVVQGRNDEFTSFDSPFTALADLVRPEMFGPGFDGGGVIIDGNVEIFTGGPRPMPMPMPVPVPPAVARAVPATTVPAAIAPDGVAADGVAANGATVASATAPSPDIAPEPTAPGTTAPVVGDDPVILPGDGAVGGFVDIDARGVPFPQFAEPVRPRAEVAGLRLWVAWVLGSTVLAGLALMVAVRRVSLPSARDAS
jgi:ABC-type transport system involved in multi-copper enzyme maturation permease subunit